MIDRLIDRYRYGDDVNDKYEYDQDYGSDSDKEDVVRWQW